MTSSLLWRGGVTSGRGAEKKLGKNLYLYESCRSAIYSFSMFQIREGRADVYVASFTCDAVIDALRDSGARIRFYELDIDFNVRVDSILESSIDPDREWVLWQCTMGHLGDQNGSIKRLQDRNMMVFGDLALSFGSSVSDKAYVDIFEGAFVSFECSKLLSAGWGGGLFFRSKRYMEYYESLNSVSATSSFLRYAQERFCFYYHSRFDCNSSVYAMFDLLRKALTLFNLFRRSAESNNPSNIGFKIGFLQERSILILLHELDNRRRSEANEAYWEVYSYAQKYGVITPKVKKNVTYCTPRFPFFIEYRKVEEVIECSKSLGIVVGDWFQNNNTFSDLSFMRDKKKYVCMNFSLIGLSDQTLKRYAVFFNKIASATR
jgi:hypothetical protein